MIWGLASQNIQLVQAFGIGIQGIRLLKVARGWLGGNQETFFFTEAITGNFLFLFEFFSPPQIINGQPLNPACTTSLSPSIKCKHPLTMLTVYISDYTLVLTLISLGQGHLSCFQSISLHIYMVQKCPNFADMPSCENGFECVFFATKHDRPWKKGLTQYYFFKNFILFFIFSLIFSISATFFFRNCFSLQKNIKRKDFF